MTHTILTNRTLQTISRYELYFLPEVSEDASNAGRRRVCVWGGGGGGGGEWAGLLSMRSCSNILKSITLEMGKPIHFILLLTMLTPTRQYNKPQNVVNNCSRFTQCHATSVNKGCGGCHPICMMVPM